MSQVQNKRLSVIGHVKAEDGTGDLFEVCKDIDSGELSLFNTRTLQFSAAPQSMIDLLTRRNYEDDTD